MDEELGDFVVEAVLDFLNSHTEAQLDEALTEYDAYQNEPEQGLLVIGIVNAHESVILDGWNDVSSAGLHIEQNGWLGAVAIDGYEVVFTEMRRE
jgi:hypothetical protein